MLTGNTIVPAIFFVCYHPYFIGVHLNFYYNVVVAGTMKTLVTSPDPTPSAREKGLVTVARFLVCADSATPDQYERSSYDQHMPGVIKYIQYARADSLLHCTASLSHLERVVGLLVPCLVSVSVIRPSVIWRMSHNVCTVMVQTRFLFCSIILYFQVHSGLASARYSDCLEIAIPYMFQYRCHPNLSALSDVRDFFRSNTKCLLEEVIFLGGAYFNQN